ncbi:hypothetical protein FS837_002092 [Tulasnella sp. UAMH 9824]|nr:hypothetical protein FS837_002092 [Tulasnella sp. UAMH 9824]
MFGKLLSTRTPATTSSPAPRFRLGPNPQSVSKKPSSLVKKLFSVKNVLRSPSSSKKNVTSQGTSYRHQGISTSYRPSQGPTALTQNDRTRRDYLRSDVESTRSPELLNVPFHSQTGRQSSTSASAPHATSTHNSHLLAPPQFVTTIPDTNRAPVHPAFQRSTGTAASRSTISSKTSSAVARPQAVTTTPTTTILSARSSFQPSTNSAARRSASFINRSPLFAPHKSTALAPTTTFSPAGLASRRSTRSAADHPKSPADDSSPLAIPQSITTTPPIAASPVFSPIRCPKPTRYLLHTREIIAKLEKIAAATDTQYNNCVQNVRSTTQDEVVRRTKSVVDECGSAKRRLDNLKRLIVAMEDDCSQLKEHLWEEGEKIDKAEVVLKKAHRNLEETDKKYANLQTELYEMQRGRFVNRSWYQRGSEPKTPQHAKQVVENWDPQSESQIALAQYSLSQAVQAVQNLASSEPENARSEIKRRLNSRSAALESQWVGQGRLGQLVKEPRHAKPSQGSVAVPNKSKGRTNDSRIRDAHRVATTGRLLLRGQLAPQPPVPAGKNNSRSSKQWGC